MPRTCRAESEAPELLPSAERPGADAGAPGSGALGRALDGPGSGCGWAPKQVTLNRNISAFHGATFAAIKPGTGALVPIDMASSWENWPLTMGFGWLSLACSALSSKMPIPKMPIQPHPTPEKSAFSLGFPMNNCNFWSTCLGNIQKNCSGKRQPK